MSNKTLCYIIVSTSLRTGEKANSDVYTNLLQAQKRVAELSQVFKGWNTFYIDTAILIGESYEE